MIIFIKKTCYISVPIIVCIIILLLKLILNVPIFKIVEISKVDTMIGIIGTLIGFLLTSITIFTSLPKNNIVMERAIKYKHHEIFTRCILIGILFCIFTILFWLLNLNIYYIYLFFLLSFIETSMAAWYIYKFCLFSIN